MSHEDASHARARLFRKLAAVARPPRQKELELLDALYARAASDRASVPRNRFLGMHAHTASRRTLHHVDPDGYAHYKVDGVAAQAAWVTASRTAQREPPPRWGVADAAADAADTGIELYGRADTVLLVLRDGSTHAVDMCALPARKNGRTLLDGELCLRARRLSADAKERLAEWANSPRFEPAPLDPDDGDATRDADYELCFAAHDCIVADSWQQTKAKSKRVAPPVAASRYEERLRALAERTKPRLGDAAALETARRLADALLAAGRTELPLRVFAKQPLPLHKLELMARCLPRALVGVRTDGLVLMGDAAPYVAGTCATLLRVKWQHTVDLRLQADADGAPRFYVVDRREPLPCAGLHCGADRAAYELAQRAHAANQAADDAALFVEHEAAEARGLVLEFAPHIEPAARAALDALPIRDAAPATLLARVAPLVAWTPVLARAEKRAPNSLATFCGVLEALAWPCTLADIGAHARTQSEQAQQQQ